MNKLLLLCGMVLLGNTSAPDEKINLDETVQERTIPLFENPIVFLNLYSGEDLYESNEVFLADGFTTETLDTANGEYEGETTEVDLGFDPNDYLPENFDPYANPSTAEGIPFMEEEEIHLGFDPAAYLPKGFDPYNVYFDVSLIPYLEEEEIDLGFETADHLPNGFDPYANPSTIEGISFMEEEEEVNLGFDPSVYLPIGFDPHDKK